MIGSAAARQLGTLRTSRRRRRRRAARRRAFAGRRTPRRSPRRLGRRRPGGTAPPVWRSRRSVTTHPSGGRAAGRSSSTTSGATASAVASRSVVVARRRGSRRARTRRRGGRHTASRCPGSPPRRGTTPCPPTRLRIVISPKPIASMRCASQYAIHSSKSSPQRSGASVWRSQLAAWAAGIEGFTLEHVGIAAGAGEPRRQPVAPVLAGDVGPRGEQLAVPAVSEVAPGGRARSSGTARRPVGRCHGTGSGATAR